MTRKFLRSVLLGFLSLSFLNPLLVSADSILAYQQGYTVVFHKDGSANVFGSLVFKNTSTTQPLSEIHFDLPGASAQEMMIYQYTLPATICMEYHVDGSCLRFGEIYSSSKFSPQEDRKATYQKADYQFANNQYTVTLPTAIEPQKEIPLLIFYRTEDYTTERFGVSRIHFSSLRIPEFTSYLVHDIDWHLIFDKDLHYRMKGDYGLFHYPLTSPLSSITTLSSLTLSDIQNIHANIGSGQVNSWGRGELTLPAQGFYSAHWIRLHFWSILVTIAALAAFCGFVGVLAKWIKKRSEKSSLSEEPTDLLKRVHVVASFFNVVLILILTAVFYVFVLSLWD